MKNKNLIIGLGVLAVAGIGYYMWKKKSEKKSSGADGFDYEDLSYAIGDDSNLKIRISKLITKLKTSVNNFDMFQYNQQLLSLIVKESQNITNVALRRNILEFVYMFYLIGTSNGVLDIVKRQKLQAQILDLLKLVRGGSSLANTGYSNAQAGGQTKPKMCRYPDGTPVPCSELEDTNAYSNAQSGGILDDFGRWLLRQQSKLAGSTKY